VGTDTSNPKLQTHCGRCGSQDSLSDPRAIPTGGGRTLTMRLCEDCERSLKRLKVLK
jgi:hypothetical protein